MKPLRATNNVKVKKGRAKLLIFVVIAAIVAFLLSIPTVANKVAPVVGWDPVMVQMWASDIFFFLLGLAVIIAGIAFLSVPILGVALIVGGLALIAPVLYRWFSKNEAE